MTIADFVCVCVVFLFFFLNRNTSLTKVMPRGRFPYGCHWLVQESALGTDLSIDFIFPDPSAMKKSAQLAGTPSAFACRRGESRAFSSDDF